MLLLKNNSDRKYLYIIFRIVIENFGFIKRKENNLKHLKKIYSSSGINHFYFSATALI